MRVRSSAAGAHELHFIFHRETHLQIALQHKSWVDLRRFFVGCRDEEYIYPQKNVTLAGK